MRALSLLCVATLGGAFSLAGCSSTESRSNETAAAARSLSSGPQPRLVQEKARIGDTQGMVHLAMGDPDEKRDVTNAVGYQSIWIYKDYFQKTGRMEQTGWKQVLVPGVEDQRGSEIQKPVTQDIYQTQVNADIQVTFTGGVVSAVEQLRH